MIHRVLTGTVALLVCLVAGMTGFAQQTRVRVGQAPAPASAAPDPKAVFLQACGRCHPVERVTASRRTKAQWEETINAMVTSRGATLTPEQYDIVLKYLVDNYGQTAPVAQEAASLPGRPGQPGQAGAGSPRPPQARGGAGPDDKHIVDPEAAMRGRKTYAAGCIQCHGTQARGTERGANIVRSTVLLHDRYGSEIGPFLRKGHPTQDANSTLTDAEIADLSHFLHERLNDTLRGSPVFTVQDVLTGDRQAGEAYFNGAGKCTQCHSTTGDLAGIGKRYDPPAIQQRFLFPRPPSRGPRAGGAGGPGNAGPVAKPVTVTVTTSSGETVSGVLVHLDDFNVSLRDAAGQYRSWKRTGGLTVVKQDPYAAHVAMLDTYTDKNIHDVVAYLESLK